MTFLRLSPAEQLLRVALAFSFIYPPLAAFSDPYSWVGYFPTPLLDFVAPHQILLLHAFGMVEIMLAVWVVFARRVRIPALLMAVILFAIVGLNFAQMDVVFRDVALALASLALAMRRPAPVRTS